MIAASESPPNVSEALPESVMERRFMSITMEELSQIRFTLKELQVVEAESKEEEGKDEKIEAG